MILADCISYVAAHEKIAQDYQNELEWAKKALLNIARSGKFSIDRTVDQYAQDIWHVQSSVDKE